LKLINKTKNTVLAEEIIVAQTIFKRLKGLLGEREFKKDKALILKPANSIHTFFMRFPIDVLFVDKNNKIVGLKNKFRPWRISRIYGQAKFVIELPEGIIFESKTEKGDEIILI